MKICYDVETTGLDPQNDEILSLSIIGSGGVLLYSCFFKPVYNSEWPDAQHVNGISPEYVADAPLFSNERDKIQSIFDLASLLIGHNIDFDNSFLRAAGIHIPNVESEDVMRQFVRFIEHTYNQTDVRWMKLIECADFFDYPWGGAAHGATEDARATMFCYEQMARLSGN